MNCTYYPDVRISETQLYCIYLYVMYLGNQDNQNEKSVIDKITK